MRFDCIHCRKATTKPQSVKGAFLRMLTIVQIEVRENYELIQTILSFGEKVIVIEPNDIRERVRKRISLAQKNYGKIKDDIDI